MAKLQACKEAEAEAAAAAAAARKKKNKKGKKKQPPSKPRRREGRIRNGGTSLHGDLGDGKRWHFEMRGTPQAKRKLQEEIGEFEERHNLYGLRAKGLTEIVASVLSYCVLAVRAARRSAECKAPVAVVVVLSALSAWRTPANPQTRVLRKICDQTDPLPKVFR